MARKFKRPGNKKELESLEVEGLWKGIILSKKIAESDEKITLDVILRIHRVIFEYAIPEAAGVFRRSGQDVKKLKYIEPPPGRLVQERMYAFARELDVRMAKISRQSTVKSKGQRKKWLDSVFYLAAWVQYQITSIHPFCEGNGRLARLMTNLILRRFGIHSSRVKIEGEDKQRYLSALGQIDNYLDFEPLKKIIIESAIDTLQKEEKLRKNIQKKYA
jgi:fido (protein-threonine AMPylation protein)